MLSILRDYKEEPITVSLRRENEIWYLICCRASALTETMKICKNTRQKLGSV